MLTLGLLGARREARAFFAPWMLAIGADFIWTKGGFATVAGTPHTHADGFGDSGQLQIGGRLPLSGLQGQSIFGKEYARFLLLQDTVVGGHGGLGNSGSVAHWYSGSGRSTTNGVMTD